MSFVGGGLWFLWSPDAAATVTATATAAAGEVTFVGHAGLGIGSVRDWSNREIGWLPRLGGGSNRKPTWLGRPREWKPK